MKLYQLDTVVTYDSESTASFQSSTYNWSAIDFGGCILVSGSNREKGILFGAMYAPKVQT